ncbi:MAG: exo-alpha-sialidase, partial [Gemmatimonadota bacterium]
PAFATGTPTTDLLRGASSDFVGGMGINLAESTGPWGDAPEGHGEVEWPLVIRRYADGALTNEEGDTFSFRMVDEAGAPAEGPEPLLTLTIPPGHLGGTFVETPGRIGPWQASNGDLYFVMEPAESDNLFMMVKSSDGGRTWREVDGANRPATGDLESVDGRQVGETIHIIHQVTESTRYHAFRTSDHPTHPDSWAVRDEVAATSTAVAQLASLAVRSDGSMVSFHVGETVHYSVRSSTGVWGPEVIMDEGEAPSSAGPQAVVGREDVVHLTYYGMDGTIWYRRLLRDGTLTERVRLASGAGATRAEFGSVLPLIYIPGTDTVVIVYRLDDGRLWERRVGGDAPPSPAVRVTDRNVVVDAVDAQQPGADVVLDEETVHVLFIDSPSRSIYSTHDGGGWQPSTLRVDEILGSWVRGNVYTKPDGTRVYGYVYDAGSFGGAGMNRFGEIELRDR